MAKRPDISIILLYNLGVIRADFNRGNAEPVFKIEESVDVESTLQESVQHVVAGPSPIASRAVVISTDVWSQIITLPRLSVSDLEPEELNEVLKFEAETLSGIEIDEISLAAIPLGRQDDLQRYWVMRSHKTILTRSIRPWNPGVAAKSRLLTRLDFRAIRNPAQPRRLKSGKSWPISWRSTPASW